MPELWVLCHSHDNLRPHVSEIRNENAAAKVYIYALLLPVGLGILHDFIERLFHFLFCLQIDLHAACIGFVKNVLREDLEDHRIPYLF